MNATPTTDPWRWLGSDPSDVARLMRKVDWATTSAGSVESWPNSLRTLITTMLRARQPMFLWWGPDHLQFYNDGYVPSFGVGRHPAALGQRGAECWAEIWPIIGPEIRGVIESGEATFHEDALVPIFRNGRMEEVYWTYGYSPVLDEAGKVAGVLVVVTETTSRVVAGRRLQVARALAEATSIVADCDDLVKGIVALLGNAREDAPWSLAYRSEAARAQPTMIAAAGLDDTQTSAIIAAVGARSRAGSDPHDLAHLTGLPGTPWPEPSTQAVTVSFQTAQATYTVVIGLSPRLPYDAGYAAHAAGITRQLNNAAQKIASQDARTAAEGARNDLLMQAPFAAALMVGPGWRYELANRLYVQMVGREVSGRRWRDCFPELIDGPVEAILRRVYQGGEPFVASEQLVPLARESDGVVEERSFDFNMIPIRDPAGTVGAMMVVAVEITAQVRARRELEHTAVERELLVERLEAASRAKDAFLAMMGHELRNPLAPMVTALAVLEQRGLAAPEHEVIARQVAHLTRLVDDLLDVSRVASGKIELRRSVCDVGAIVDHVVETVAPLLEQRRHALTVAVDRSRAWQGDGTRLEQILVNLLTNAARYTPPGGRVQFTGAAEGETLVFRIRDNGQGIDAALVSQIFEPFVQAERSIDRREGGLGLGLAIVRGLVALHGGTVAASSEGIGKGSEFVVRLPGLVTTVVTPRETRMRDATPPRVAAPKRMLLVDDNEDAVELLAQYFRHMGHDVVVAYDGPRALAIAAAHAPEVAILDIGLPIMDGYELIRKLRPTATRCRFIALSGYGQADDIERARAAGFEKLLAKPVDMDLLLQTVRAL